MIQGSINQLLQTAAVAARLDPNVESRAESQKLKKLSKMTQQAFAIEQGLGPVPIDRQQEFAKKNLEIAQAQYELNPTQKGRETVQEYQRQYDIGEERKVERELRAKHNRASAEAKIKLAQEQARVGRELVANAPKPTTGKKETIKYDNI